MNDDIHPNFHSIIKSADRDSKKDALRRRVSFHNIREVQKYNWTDMCHVIAKERMTPTNSSDSDRPAVSAMSTSIVTEMISNVSVADESISLAKGPQAASTPMFNARRSFGRRRSDFDVNKPRKSISASNITDSTGQTIFNVFEHIKGHVGYPHKPVSERSPDIGKMDEMSANGENVPLEMVSLNDINGVIIDPYDKKGAPGDGSILCSAEAMDGQSGDGYIDILKRRFPTPTSTPRSRPTLPRKTPRRTIDRTWLVDFEDESEPLAHLQADAEASLSDFYRSKMTDRNDEIEYFDDVPYQTHEDSVLGSPRLKKAKHSFTSEAHWNLVSDSASLTNVNQKKMEKSDDKADSAEKSADGIDASLFNSLLRMQKQRSINGTPFRFNSFYFKFPFTRSLLSGTRDSRDSISSSNSFKSDFSFKVSSDEEFSATIIKPEKASAQLQLAIENHKKKKQVYDIMETIMKRCAQLAETESRMDAEISRAFDTFFAEIKN